MTNTFILLSLLGHTQATLPPALVETPKVPFSVVKPVEKHPVAPERFVEFSKLDFQPFPYSPMGTFSNPYPYGQCTYGAASMKGNIPVWGNANQWDDNARAQGYVVSDMPIVGTVAVDNAGEYGHVSVVIGVGDGQVQVREMNYDWNGSVRDYWYPTSKFVYIYI